MAKVVFQIPGTKVEQTLEVKVGENILEASQRQNIKIETECGGCASCGQCHIIIKDGAKALNGSDFLERSLLKNKSDLTSESRLACQAKAVA